jgi:hypothetical protein
MRKILKSGEAVYYISQRSGGPTIQLLGGGIFADNYEKVIRPGFISYFPTYWNTLSSRNEKPPLELIETYKALQNHVKNAAVRIKPGRSVFWLGEDARKAVLKGAKLIGFEQSPIPELIGSSL